MKKIFTLATLALAFTISAFAADDDNTQATGIFLSGTMNDWSENDPQWELKAEPQIPGWACIDLSSMPAGTQFRIVGHNRNYGMKNTRNTIRQNSMHLMTLDGANNLVACDESLDGVHLMVQSDVFTTDKYIGILTITDESQVLYGACMQSSVTPTLLQPIVNTPYTLAAEVDITEPFYIVKAYQLSNATQTVCNYGLSDTQGILRPTSNLTPEASPIPVPADGAGKYMVAFNYQTYSYSVGGDTSVEAIPDSDNLSDGDNTETIYYNLQGIRVANPLKGNIYIRLRNNRPSKITL